MRQGFTHSSHWGAFTATGGADELRIVPHREDPNPSAILQNLVDAPRHRSRVAQPSIRKGWLDRRAGHRTLRGADDYVAVSWDTALDLVGGELGRVVEANGIDAVFGGSYGWSSAGRFHHAQSQVHRFLNCAIGGYTKSVNTYSAGSSAVLLPHILAPMDSFIRREDTWRHLREQTDLVVAFGGIPVRNSSVSAGGITHHIAEPSLREAAGRGCRFVLVGPVRDDLPTEVTADWMAIRPSTDVALMLGLAHTLISRGLHDKAFLASHCSGFETLEAYIMGTADGVAKSPQWAAAICGIEASRIVALAVAMAAGRTLITASHSLQRAQYGEQPIWMALALAAILGQFGLPGAGFSYALGALGNVGKPPIATPSPTLPQGTNGCRSFIPVARIADMLLDPGGSCEYNGATVTYPDIRLVYWAGGNPFHHHQDLNRLRRAFERPETIIVHEPYWTATARHADIVLPSTITMEREDIGASSNDSKLFAMHRIVEPFAGARDDHDIFRDLCERIGGLDAFTEGRTTRQWLAYLYEPLRQRLQDLGEYAPDFNTLWEQGEIDLPVAAGDGPFAAFRADPATSPLPTQSGRIELFSQRIASFGYADCPGHPAWLEPDEWLGAAAAADFPLQLVANQPSTRLHSQLDFGRTSAARKVDGREPVRINPADAAQRGIASGDTVLIRNARGECLAGAVVSEHIRPGVAQLSTGAWFTPDDPTAERARCLHGNPNVLTRDIGTSRLAQGCAGQLCLVEIEKYTGDPALPDPYAPPRIY